MAIISDKIELMVNLTQLKDNLWMKFVLKNKYIIISCLLFAILYSLISLVNHYNFRTYALDLGLYTNAAFRYAHFQLADSTLIKEYYEPILGGHFDLYLILFSPLIFIFGTNTLLIVQIIALVSGGVGVYYYFDQTDSKNKTLPLFAAIYFFSFFGIFGALSFDYHSVVVASSIVPWFFVAIKLNKKILSAILLGFILVSQENISLWIFFICIALAIEYRKEFKKTSLLLLFSGISLAYFFIVITYIIPHFSTRNEYSGFMYSILGNNIFEALKFALIHPLDCLRLLFINHSNNPIGDFVKAELHVLIILSGLPLLFIKPQYLLMLIPIYFQKLFHDNYAVWSIGAQYNIEYAPILAIGIFTVISQLKKRRIQIIVSSLVLFLATLSTIRTLDNTIFYTEKSRINFLRGMHYRRNYDVKSVHQCLQKIPEDAKVSAQSPFVPHLSLRKYIYQFPIIKNADYIVFSVNEIGYPLSQEEFDKKINELKSSEDWEVLCNKDLTILKKVSL